MEQIRYTRNEVNMANSKKIRNYFFIQWKGTDLCMDFHCKCGDSFHFDGDFCYYIECIHCGRVYKMPTEIEGMEEVEMTDKEKLDRMVKIGFE